MSTNLVRFADNYYELSLFSDAVAHCLAEGDELEDEREAGALALAAQIQTAGAVGIVLRIDRLALEGDEVDELGFARSGNGADLFVFFRSNCSPEPDLMVAAETESYTVVLSRYLQVNGWNLCQLVGTEITNYYPAILGKTELASVLDLLAESSGLGWEDVGDEAETTDEFLERSYSEQTQRHDAAYYL